MKTPYPEETQLEKKKQEDFYTILLPEINSSKVVKKVAVDLPAIGESAATDIATPEDQFDPNNIIEPQPIIPGQISKDYEAIYKRIDELQDLVDSLMLEQKLQETSDKIMEKVEHMLFDLKKRIDDLYDKKVPSRSFYDTEGAYTSQLFTLACEVLDKVIPQVFDDVPRYSLISTSVSDVYDDGTVENALVALSVTLSNEGNRYDFKVDLPVLGGVIQTPYYFERGRRLIPLTESALRRELESFSYRKMDVEKPMEKPNLYSNIGSNPLKREDTQKYYEVNDTPQKSELPYDSSWNTSRGTRG